MTYPRFVHGKDGDDVSQQELVNRDDTLDDALRDAENSTLNHFSDPGAHPQINSRFATAAHDHGLPPTPTAAGRYALNVDAAGVKTWVPF